MIGMSLPDNFLYIYNLKLREDVCLLLPFYFYTFGDKESCINSRLKHFIWPLLPLPGFRMNSSFILLKSIECQQRWEIIGCPSTPKISQLAFLSHLDLMITALLIMLVIPNIQSHPFPPSPGWSERTYQAKVCWSKKLATFERGEGNKFT